MANTSNADWDPDAPADNDPRQDGALEIRVLRGGLKERIGKEHIDPDAADVGGEHIAGSAMVYREATPGPTLRPDGVTALDTDDTGRLWLDDTNEQLYFWDGTAWVAVLASPSGGALPDTLVDFTGVALDTFSASVVSTFVPRVVTIHKDDGSEGWGGTFILPDTPLETSAFLRLYLNKNNQKSFELERSGVDGFTLKLKYTGANVNEFNGTWRARVVGAVGG